MPAFQHILVPTDFGDASERALATALDLAAVFGSQVTIMHATLLPPYTVPAEEEVASLTYDADDPATKQLNAVVSKARQRYARVDGALMIGTPWARILEASKERDADLIIMGTHGRRGISRMFLGSVAEKIVRLSTIPVMTVSTEQDHSMLARAETG